MTTRWLTPGVGTSAVGAACAGLALLVAGGWGGVSAALGAAVVLLFFGSGGFALRVAGSVSEQGAAIGIAVLLSAYSIRLGTVFVLIRLADGSGRISGPVFATTAGVCTAVWMVLLVVRYAKEPTISPRPHQEQSGADGANAAGGASSVR